jgi:hypothetical protein
MYLAERCTAGRDRQQTATESDIAVVVRATNMAMLIKPAMLSRQMLSPIRYCRSGLNLYGDDWYGYNTRRLKEDPGVAGYVAKAAIGF